MALETVALPGRDRVMAGTAARLRCGQIDKKKLQVTGCSEDDCVVRDSAGLPGVYV